MDLRRVCAVVSCNEAYLPHAIVTLRQFQSYHPRCPAFVLGTRFSARGKHLAESYNVGVREADLSGDFVDLDRRHREHKKYPIECFHHIYSPVEFGAEFDFVVALEPDICTNRPLDIDWESVRYIAGSAHRSPNRLIKGYTPLLEHWKKIKTRWPQARLSHHTRHAGGVRVYNVAGLNSVNFYRTIVSYYQDSLKIGARRNGDDSLMVMYQMMHPDQVLVLPTAFNLISDATAPPLSLGSRRDIQFYHLGGDHKYWNRSSNLVSTPSPEVRYFKDKMVRFLYNRFPLRFVRDHFPTLYCDISKTVVPVYHYGACDNFGDFITPYLLRRFCSPEQYTLATEAPGIKVLGCGSIMRIAKRDTVVCGSGIRDRKQAISPAVVQCARGPLTRKRLQEVGGYCPPVYGDPGLLLPQVYPAARSATHALGIVPHVVHYQRAKKAYKDRPDTLIVDLRTRDVEAVVDQLARCRCVISSSLHGLIVSDAYGIPNQWVHFTDEIRGDGTKFQDYFASVGRSCPRPLDLAGFAPLPPDIEEQVPPSNISIDLGLLRENMCIDIEGGGITPYTKYLVERLREGAKK